MEITPKTFGDFLEKERILISDPNASSRTGLAKALTDLGVKMSQITLAGGFDSAKQAVEDSKPTMIISDFNLGEMSALDLFELPSFSSRPIDERISVIVTNNTSQAAIAQAAEGDVDVFIAKPYSLNSLKTALFKAVADKLEPSEYLKAIQEGKRHLISSDLDQALAVFESAAQLDYKPALAYFYQGYTHTLLGSALEKAQESYSKGLEYNHIHYKCLIGLFEALLSQKKNQDAYVVLRRIIQNFPVNPNRLISALKLAITTGNYLDVERYHEVFVEIEIKSDLLVRSICAALITVGKYLIRSGETEKALKLLQKAGVSAGGRTAFLSEIILTLVGAELPLEADKYLSRFPQETRTTTEYLSLDYLVMSKSGKLDAVINRGRKLLQQGTFHPLIDRIFLETLMKAKLKRLAEAHAEEAASRWPNQAGRIPGDD